MSDLQYDSFGQRVTTRLRSFNPEQVAAFGRTIAQSLAAIFVARGWLDESTAVTMAAAIVWIVITWWGVWARKDKNLLASAANVPTIEAVVTSSREVAAKVPNPKVTTTTMATDCWPH